ncbi:MAG: MATE family efflux transporter [Rhodobacteraceae bacterium]|nr:MATE family efflux transporter [Paracoccaceae bacterium]
MFRKSFYNEQHKLIIRTAAPLSIGFGLQSFMGITEALVVAQSGAVALAAVSIAASLAGLMYLITIGFVSASVPLIAKAVAKKQEKVTQVAMLSSLVILVCSTLFGMLVLLATVHYTHLLSIPTEVAKEVSAWIIAALFGYPAMCLFFWFRSIGTALGQTGFVGRVLAVTAVAHLVVLLLFAFDSPFSFGWGAFGAGIAHGFASWVALFGSVYSIFLSPKSKIKTVIPFTWAVLNLGREMKQHVVLGVVVTSRIFLVEGFGYFLVLILPLLVSAVEISAHTIGFRVASISATLALGVSSAVAAHVGFARGRNAINEAASYSNSALEIGIAIGLLCMIGLLIMTPPLLQYLEAQGASISIIFILMIAAYQAIAVIQSTATGALLGFEKTIAPLIATAVGPWCTCLGLIFLTSLILKINILHVWSCLVVGYLLSCTICVLSLKNQITRERKLAA